jgi:hypothetical protein
MRGDRDRERIVDRCTVGCRHRFGSSCGALLARRLVTGGGGLAALGLFQNVGQIHRLILGDDQAPVRRHQPQFADVQAIRSTFSSKSSVASVCQVTKGRFGSISSICSLSTAKAAFVGQFGVGGGVAVA